MVLIPEEHCDVLARLGDGIAGQHSQVESHGTCGWQELTELASRQVLVYRSLIPTSGWEHIKSFRPMNYKEVPTNLYSYM